MRKILILVQWLVGHHILALKTVVRSSRLSLSTPETYAVVLKETGEAIGSIGIMTVRSEIYSAKMADSECEIGFWIGEPFWGKGLIPEVVNELLRYIFEDLRKTAVWCGYFDGNKKSKRA